MITMYDAIVVANIPSDAAAVAGYTDGEWVTAPVLAARFPHARLLTIAVDAARDAECLDIEAGDAPPESAASWYGRQVTRGISRPCLYASASVMQSRTIPVLDALCARSAVRLWSAHYTGTAHICGPSSCGATSIEMDGTQWTENALGRDLDESLLLDDFFGSAPPVPVIPAWQEAIMNVLPTLKLGDKDTSEPWMVRRVQALCTALGSACKIDGTFGASTANAVAAVQRDHGVTADSVVGPVTWSVLVTGSTT